MHDIFGSTIYLIDTSVSDRYLTDTSDTRSCPIICKEKASTSKGSPSFNFQGSLAQVNKAECQEKPGDADAEGREEINLATITHSVGVFAYPETCCYEKSKPILQEDSLSGSLARMCYAKSIV